MRCFDCFANPLTTYCLVFEDITLFFIHLVISHDIWRRSCIATNFKQ
jgi:hypothetical protein